MMTGINGRAGLGVGDVDITIFTPLFTSIFLAFNNKATISVCPFFTAKARGVCKEKEDGYDKQT